MQTLEKRLLRLLARASGAYRLLEPGDRILVGISGGKDSWTLLHLLRLIQRRVPFDFSLIAVNLDQGHPGFPGHRIEEYLRAEGYEYRMLKEDTYSIVLDKVPEGRTQCSLCSRLRRGVLYNAAVDLGATKIALGHHRDDLLETVLLNLFFSGQLKTMPPRLESDDGRNTVIRPLVHCAEEDIARFAEELDFPIIPCDLCGTQENLQRQRIKRLLADLEGEIPDIRASMLAALGNVRPTHLLDQDLLARIAIDPVPLSELLTPAVAEA